MVWESNTNVKFVEITVIGEEELLKGISRNGGMPMG